MKQVEKLVDVLIKKAIIEAEVRDIIIYGLRVGLELFLNILTTIALGFVFQLVFESLTFIVSFSFIRIYAGGYHCKKAINCYLMSNGIVVIVLAIIKLTSKKVMIVAEIVILIISIPLLWKFAPAETPTKLLDKDEQKYFHKKMIINLIVECTVFSILIFSGLHNFAFGVSLGIILSVFFVLLQKIIQKTN